MFVNILDFSVPMNLLSEVSQNLIHHYGVVGSILQFLQRHSNFLQWIKLIHPFLKIKQVLFSHSRHPLEFLVMYLFASLNLTAISHRNCSKINSTWCSISFSFARKYWFWFRFLFWFKKINTSFIIAPPHFGLAVVKLFWQS